MVRIVMIVAALGLLAGVAGAEPISEREQDVVALADPILDNILQALKAGDHAKYQRDFGPIMRAAATAKAFGRTRDVLVGQLGGYRSRAYLGLLRKGGMTVVLYKAAFDKTRDDTLIKLVLVRRDGKVVVTGLWFQ